MDVIKIEVSEAGQTECESQNRLASANRCV